MREQFFEKMEFSSKRRHLHETIVVVETGGRCAEEIKNADGRVLGGWCNRRDGDVVQEVEGSDGLTFLGAVANEEVIPSANDGGPHRSP